MPDRFEGTRRPGGCTQLCFLDATGEALAGILRPGNAASNTATDHIAVVDHALAQIPDAHRHGTDILIRSDSAGASKACLTPPNAVNTPVPDQASRPTSR